MRALLRYAAGYVIDFFRERVTAADFAGESVGRVLLTPGLGPEDAEAVRRLFPGAELRSLDGRTNLWRVRRCGFDAACIAMAGGGIRERVAALLSGAPHKLLVPSPDYIYRLGIRVGPCGLVWGVVDRFLIAPFALAWLGALAIAAYGSGLVGRAAARKQEPWRPERVLVIRLVPTGTFVHLLRRLRRRLPGARLVALLGSEEGRAEVAAACDEVLSPRVSAARGAKGGGFDSVILAGGADYGLGRTYVKAALLARLYGGAQRYQWEVGDELPGMPLGAAVRRAVVWGRAPVRRVRPGPLGRWLARRRYAREPERGPRIAQIGITKACNYHCLFCPFHSPEAEKGHKDAELPRMSYETFARVLGDLKRMGTRGIDICGDGEPLTHPEAMEMIALARELEFDVTLATNAALLTRRRARQLVDLKVRRMHVSFNAATNETYTRLHPGAPPDARDSIVAQLREMAEYAEAEGKRPIDVEFSAVLNRLNMDEIPAMVEAAHEA
ncbi:MAG: radical SAM protein, partial [Armatimonadota bacterium]